MVLQHLLRCSSHSYDFQLARYFLDFRRPPSRSYLWLRRSYYSTSQGNLGRHLKIPAREGRFRIHIGSEIKYLRYNERLEEECAFNFPNFAPIELGQIIEDRYKVISKLGWGGEATYWLCTDIRSDSYVTVSVSKDGLINFEDEIEVYKRIQNLKSPHPGRLRIRKFIDGIERPYNASGDSMHTHASYLVFEPLGMDTRTLKTLYVKTGLPNAIIKNIAVQVLLAVDFLHTEAKIIHRDIKPSSVFLGLTTHWTYCHFESYEKENPLPRKIVSDGGYTIFTSRIPHITEGMPVLGGFSHSIVKSKVDGPYHQNDPSWSPPETVLDIGCDEKVDIWAVGLTIWSLLQPQDLFQDYDVTMKHPHTSDKLLARQLNDMSNALGPPPAKFMQKTNISNRFWDERGCWIPPLAPLYRFSDEEMSKLSLEDRVTSLDGEEKEEFLDFMRHLLAWDPQDRPSAKEALEHPWLRKTYHSICLL